MKAEFIVLYALCIPRSPFRMLPLSAVMKQLKALQSFANVKLESFRC